MGTPNASAHKDLDPQEVLRFIVEKERLTKTLRHFDVTKVELQALLFGEEEQAPVEEKTPPKKAKKAKKATETKTQKKSSATQPATSQKTTPKSKSSSKATKASKNTKPPKAKEPKGSSASKKQASTSSNKEETTTKEPTKAPKTKGSRRSSSRGRRNVLLELEDYTYQRLLIYSDGAARGNPGESGAGVVLKTPEGEEVGRFGKYLGRKTNNYAEYQAVLLGLNHAREFGASEITILSDSDLLVRQLLGEYRVRAAHLRELFDQVKGLLTKFEKYQVKRIGREKNSEADSMANRAIDEKL